MAETKSEHALIFCSFCGRHKYFVEKLAASPAHAGKVTYICKTCAGMASELMEDGVSND